MKFKISKFLEFNKIISVLQILILIIGLYLTITQIRDLRRVSAGQIVLDINRDIYSNERYPSNLKIIKLIEQNKPILINNGGKFQDQDLDNLLGAWDTITRLNDVGVIPDDLVYSQFSFDIVKAYKNEEIKDYIKKIRIESKDPLIFADFERLAEWMNKSSLNR